MHLETIGNSQSVYIFTHQLVTKLTWCTDCDLDWLNRWLVVWLAGWLWLGCWLIVWLVELLVGTLIDWLLDCSWLIICSSAGTVGLFGGQIDGLDGWLSQFCTGQSCTHCNVLGWLQITGSDIHANYVLWVFNCAGVLWWLQLEDHNKNLTSLDTMIWIE